MKDSFDTAGVVSDRRHARPQGLRARHRRDRRRARARGRRDPARQDQHAGVHARRRRQRHRQSRLRAHEESVRRRAISRAAPRAAPARSSRPRAPTSTSARTTAARSAARLSPTASRASSRRSAACRAPGHIVGYGGAFDSFQETGPLARRVEDLTLLMPMLCGPRRLGRRDGARAARRSRGRRSEVAARRVLHDERRGRSDARDAGDGHANRRPTSRKLGAKVTEDTPPKMKELARGAPGVQRRRRPRAHAAPAEAARHDAGVAGPAPRRRRGAEPGVHALVRRDGRDQERAARVVREIRPHRLPRERARADPARLRAARPIGRAGASYTSQYNTTGWPAGVVRCGTSTEAAGTAARHSGRRSTLARRRRARGDGATSSSRPAAGRCPPI